MGGDWYSDLSETDPEHWANIGIAALTLAQVDHDDWAAVMTNVIEAHPFVDLFHQFYSRNLRGVTEYGDWNHR